MNDIAQGIAIAVLVYVVGVFHGWLIGQSDRKKKQ